MCIERASERAQKKYCRGLFGWEEGAPKGWDYHDVMVSMRRPWHAWHAESASGGVAAAEAGTRSVDRGVVMVAEAATGASNPGVAQYTSRLRVVHCVSYDTRASSIGGVICILRAGAST